MTEPPAAVAPRASSSPRFTKVMLTVDGRQLALLRRLAATLPEYGYRGLSRLVRDVLRAGLASEAWAARVAAAGGPKGAPSDTV